MITPSVTPNPSVTPPPRPFAAVLTQSALAESIARLLFQAAHAAGQYRDARAWEWLRPIEASRFRTIAERTVVETLDGLEVRRAQGRTVDHVIDLVTDTARERLSPFTDGLIRSAIHETFDEYPHQLHRAWRETTAPFVVQKEA